MHDTLTRGAVAYVREVPGDMPNRIRAWPQVKPERPEGTIIGKAPEGSALLLLDDAGVKVRVGGRNRRFSNPHTDGQGREWWYVRAYDRDDKTVVQGWTAANDGGQSFLARVPEHQACKVTMHTWRSTHLSKGMQAYVVPSIGLKVREGPSTDFKKVGGLPAGALVTVRGEPKCDDKGLVWWQIKGGWVCESEPFFDPDERIEWYLLPLKT